jgi:NADPH-dependent 7-cyano-7-deazaguanine reductase QueF-like protein
VTPLATSPETSPETSFVIFSHSFKVFVKQIEQRSFNTYKEVIKNLREEKEKHVEEGNSMVSC